MIDTYITSGNKEEHAGEPLDQVLNCADVMLARNSFTLSA